MRVLFLTPWYPNESNPDYGIFVRNQAVALAEKHEIHVIFSKVDYTSFGFLSFRKTSDAHGKIDETRIYIKRSFPIYNQLNFFLITVWYTWRAGKKFKPDLIHGNISYPGGFWAWLIARLLGCPFVMTEHTRVIHNFRSPIHRWLSLFSMRRAAAIHTVSTRMAEEIKTFTGKTCFVIPNIIAAEKLASVFPAAKGNVTQIGFLGTLDRPIKGLDLLLVALAPLKKEYILHIGGDGRLESDYKRQARELGIADRCIFYGTVHHWEVPALMSKFHFFVNASRYESFGMAVLEAAACGLPVVATRCGGPDDFVTEEIGKLIPVEDIEALRGAVTWMIDHHANYDPLKLKQYVAQRFAPASIAQQIDQMYMSVLRK